MRALSALTVLLAVASTACRDASGPTATLTVAVDASSAQGVNVRLNDAGLTVVECRIALEATATGRGTATWVDGSFMFYGGRDRSVALDTGPISVGTLVNAFSAAEIEAGETLEAQIGITAPFPYSVTFRFRYRTESGGAVRTAEAPFTCGPTLPAISPPPTMTALTVQPSGQVEPGQSINVAFIAQSL